MLRQRKNMLDSMIFEVKEDDVLSSESEVKETVKPAKKKKKNKKRKKNLREAERIAEPLQKLNVPKTSKKSGNSHIINISTDEYIVLSDDCDEEVLEARVIPQTAVEIKAVLSSEISPTIKPLISVRFRDARTANLYKSRIRAFVQHLLTLDNGNECQDVDTDLELNIWHNETSNSSNIPDHVDSVTVNVEPVNDNTNIFIIDTSPMEESNADVPAYSNKFSVLKDGQEQEMQRTWRKALSCFNCDGSHSLKDCSQRKDYARINQKRKAITKVGRYHTEDEQRFGHLVPGRISRKLRNALNLHKNQLPLHIYRMRILGYPPGWIEAARIEHSGMNLFDSLGKTIADPEDEEGQIYDAGSKDKFDIKKIYDFPGFNVPASSRYKEECGMYGCPPIADHQSKMVMLQEMAPNAMQAYKRRKLTLMDTTGQDDVILNETDMDIESDDGECNGPDFPFVPPLPDEPPPTPENLPPPPPEMPSAIDTDNQPSGDDPNTIMENGTNDGTESPPLSDLEKHKKALLDALAEGDCAAGNITPNSNQSDSGNLDDTPKVISQMGKVKSSAFGTPLINASSPFSKLPTGEKFSKNITDIINFENLPDSTGKYKQMSGLIKKVRTLVAKIQSDS